MSARIVIAFVVLALGVGIAVVLLDPSYRPAKIAETNRGVFVNIPLDGPAEPAESAEAQSQP